MKAKICPLCGQEFIPNSPKQKYCKKPIDLTCSVCGKHFKGKCQPDNPTTCEDTVCKKSASHAKSTFAPRVCRVCGKEFIPTSNRQLDCNKPVQRTCIVCGKAFTAKCSINDVSKTCSHECQIKYTAQQQVAAYSNETRICELCSKPFQPVNNTQKICNRTHYRKCAVCGKAFVLDTSKNRADWPDTCSRECHNAWRFHNGNPGQRLSVIRKIQETRHKGHESEFQEYLKFLQNPSDYLQTNFKDHRPTITELSNRFYIHTTTVGQLIKKYELQPYIRYTSSVMEDEMEQFIHSISSTKVERHDRDKIKPYELDLYIPEFKVAIECNPTSSHNSTIPMYDAEFPTPESYHQMKTDMCDNVGIRLIHVFGYEWNHKREIIESIIRNSLGANADKIYARKTEIRDVSDKDSKQFLNANHRQGYVPSKVRLGLYYKEELVSLMTFGKSRSTIGGDSDTWEMYRFCNKLDTSVVGGASKLFKYFMQEVNPQRIISFSDRAHTTGRLYQMLGFHELRRSKPGYVWVDAITDIAYNRVNAQKKNIKRFLNDSDIDLSHSESEIMLEHGFVKVYDSGTITWEIKQ